MNIKLFFRDGMFWNVLGDKFRYVLCVLLCPTQLIEELGTMANAVVRGRRLLTIHISTFRTP